MVKKAILKTAKTWKKCLFVSIMGKATKHIREN